jgi:prepilin peptidase CpaA
MDELKAFLELTLLLVTDPRTAVLFCLLVLAAVIDVRRHRIPNWLTGSGLVFGLVYSAFVPFWRDHGFLWSLYGAALGFGVLFPLWLMHMMGAGDVKLMAMAGSLLGLHAAGPALIGTLIVGGLFALSFAIRHSRLRDMLANIGRMLHLGSVAVVIGAPMRMATSGWESVGKLAFAVPIATGTIITVVGNHFGLF